jgi:hypothetical protein
MDVVARTRDIEAQIKRLRARQISLARYCRTQAEVVRKNAAQSKSPELHQSMLALAMHYEQIADSVEQYIRRLSQTYAEVGWSISPPKTRRHRRIG